MTDGDELESDARAADRLIFFSDAVIAIAMTLLALELPVPAGGTVSELWSSVKHNDGHYVAFLISFAAIAAAWSSHHDIFRYVSRVDARVRTLSMAWLLMIVLIPFATQLLTARGPEALDTHALRFGFYSLVQLLDSAILLAMLKHMVSHQQMPEVPPRVLAATAGRVYGPMLAFGLSIPVFFATTYGWVVWFAVPVALSRLRHGRPVRAFGHGPLPPRGPGRDGWPGP